MAAGGSIPINVSVAYKGGLFGKNIPRAVEEQIVEQVLSKIEERTRRGGRGVGVRRNTIRHDHRGALELLVSSTRIWPRTRGTAWQRKNIGIIKAMAPRVARKAAERIAAELGGA